jgi:hypothetical protein
MHREASYAQFLKTCLSPFYKVRHFLNLTEQVANSNNTRTSLGEISGSNLSWNTAYPEVFDIFPQSLQGMHYVTIAFFQILNLFTFHGYSPI